MIGWAPRIARAAQQRQCGAALRKRTGRATTPLPSRSGARARRRVRRSGCTCRRTRSDRHCPPHEGRTVGGIATRATYL